MKNTSYFFRAEKINALNQSPGVPWFRYRTIKTVS